MAASYSNKAYIEVKQPRTSTIELILRDRRHHEVRSVCVYPPSTWERWFGISWEDKVIEAFSDLDKLRVQTDLRDNEGRDIVDRFGTNLGQDN